VVAVWATALFLRIYFVVAGTIAAYATGPSETERCRVALSEHIQIVDVPIKVERRCARDCADNCSPWSFAVWGGGYGECGRGFWVQKGDAFQSVWAFLFVWKTKVRGEIFAIWCFMPAIKNLDISRWRLPMVFYGYTDLWRVLSYGNHVSANIGAKAALFSVVGSNPLLASVTGSNPCKDGRQDEESKNRILERMFAFVLSAGLLTIGLWLVMFHARQPGIRWLGIGCLIAVCGWPAVAFQDVVLTFSENVSTRDIGASAMCYSTSENVRVIPISGDHNAQMALWTESSLVQKGAVHCGY
jgi:hypothetical protein